jgi:predicted HAD superfamily hydrolase
MSIISLDIFDTILLRNALSERRRFAQIAHRACVDLSARGIRIPTQLVMNTRREAQLLAYKAVEAEHPWADVTLEQILRVQSALTDIHPDIMLPVMVAAEIEIEAKVLTPNRSLIARIDAERSRGIRTIAISDTYFSAAHVSDLFGRLLGRSPVDAIYTSADLGLTKRGGRIFSAVLEREGAAAADMRHMGDDPLADKRNPEAVGMTAQLLQRPWAVRLMRRLDAAAFRLKEVAVP